jgi:hypothetical protein
MPSTTAKHPKANDEPGLPLPSTRGLSRKQAAVYLGIGITLLAAQGVPFVQIGRRCIYDRVDLDSWLDDYKHRGRARKETLWPVKTDSTGGGIPVSGGSMWCYRTADAYAKALGLKTERKP